ncbi:MAG: cyclic nucleotide-binding domain-containing protein [Planctomycetota bacterium]
MSGSDVDWLRSREPFASLDTKAFPRSTPLEGILANDCRLHRCEPGELVVREGDYGNSAFLVLAGSVRVMLESLPSEQLGRNPSKRKSWAEALKDFLGRGSVHERRTESQITPQEENTATKIRQVDERSAIYLQDFDVVLDRYESATLGPGELFGEIAAMYRSPRTATVFADNEATLLEIRWQGLRILRRDKAFSARLEQHYRDNWLSVHLGELPLLRHLPESNLQRVVQSTQMRSFGRMEWNAEYRKTRELAPAEQIDSEPVVAPEGRVPTELVLVRTGFGRMSRQYGAAHRTTAYLGKGHLFGLDEITYNATRPQSQPPMPLQHSLRAVGFLDTLHIPVECFAAEILPHVRRSELPAAAASFLEPVQLGTTIADRRQQARDELSDRRKSGERTGRENRSSGSGAGSTDVDGQDLPSPTGTQFDSTSLVEFIVQNRFNNGRQAMVIDLHRCTRCDDCVKACASTHDGNPRFARQGASHERLQFVQACMQCTDPVCMIGCPTGAIVRDEASGVVQIHESICVGCGVCASACPYENIHMAEVFDASGRPFTDAKSGKPITKATKCDMCQSSPSGPACVSACPHDALVRIDLSESEPLEYWLHRRS